MDIGIAMSADVLEHKLECAHDGKSPETTWITRSAPGALTPGWTNRLFVACDGRWRGFFPLSGEVLWTPEDATAPWALIFDARGWTLIAPVPAARFRGWRYVDAAALGLIVRAADGSSAGRTSSSSS